METGIIVMDVAMGEDEAERWRRQLKFTMVLIGGVCMTRITFLGGHLAHIATVTQYISPWEIWR